MPYAGSYACRKMLANESTRNPRQKAIRIACVRRVWCGGRRKGRNGRERVERVAASPRALPCAYGMSELVAFGLPEDFVELGT